MNKIWTDVEDKLAPDVKLNGGAELHHVVNGAGERISTIWHKGAEVWSCSHIREAEMIKVWNDMHKGDES